jgi:hypothetical protein
MTSDITQLKRSTALQTHDDADPLSQFVLKYGDMFVGELLKQKKGKWLVGPNEDEMPITEPLVANIDEIAFGWIRLENNEVTDRVITRLADGFRDKSREELGEDDLIDAPNDPWKLCTAIILRNADGELFTYSALGISARHEIARLASTYRRQRDRHPGMMPKVLLGTDRAFSKNRRRHARQLPHA